MQTVKIQYFGKSGEVLTKIVTPADLPQLAGMYCFWMPGVLADEQMERKGKALKEKVRSRLFTKTVLTPAK